MCEFLMFSVGKQFVAAATVSAAAIAFVAPATTLAAEMPGSMIVQAAYTAPGQVQSQSRSVWDQALTAVDLAVAVQSDDGVTFSADDVSDAEAADESAAVDAELECMAKVVHHEAGNQSRRGQIAVAQTIMNRIESGRFASTICGVANQPGQFFRTSSYNPDRSGAQWKSALSVAREVRSGDTADVAPGALFFRASYASATRFFRGRQQVATLGDHVFYR
jgi:N-acetylmuramoyl-L-alanine amidase